MEYQEFLETAQLNGNLNEKGLNDLIGILKREILDLKIKIIDLEAKLQYVVKKEKSSESKNED